MSKSQKLVLDNQALEDEFFEDIKLLGLVSAAEPYHLAWRVSRHLQWNFEREHDFDIHISELSFPVYHLNDHTKFFEQFIISNRCKSFYLLQEIKHIDFLWMLKGNLQTETLTQIQHFLKSIPVITTSFELNPYQLKMKQYLIM